MLQIIKFDNCARSIILGFTVEKTNLIEKVDLDMRLALLVFSFFFFSCPDCQSHTASRTVPTRQRSGQRKNPVAGL